MDVAEATGAHLANAFTNVARKVTYRRLYAKSAQNSAQAPRTREDGESQSWEPDRLRSKIRRSYAAAIPSASAARAANAVMAILRGPLST